MTREEELEVRVGELEAHIEALEATLRTEWRRAAHDRGEHTTKVRGCWPCVRNRIKAEEAAEVTQGS